MEHEGFLEGLNEQQRQAVTHGEGPLLVVAGAGTGKTEVITKRIAYLIASGKAKASEILALTFTEKAASEMEERVDRLLPYGMIDTRIMTFHAFGDWLLKSYALDLGLDNSPTLMTQPQQIVFLRQNLDEFRLDYYAPVGNPDRYIQALANYFARLKEELIMPEDYIKFAEGLASKASTEEDKLEGVKQAELAVAYLTYRNLCRSKGLIDFSDQVGLPVELLTKRPNVARELKQAFIYVLVDEFQDTNLAQARLLELLVGAKGNLTVVGDDDQSIYKFRGAAISNILAFKERYQGIKQVVLTRNYRSTQEVLDSAYRLIQHNNPDRLEVRNNIDKRLISDKHGPLPSLEVQSTFGLESEHLAQTIKRRIDEGQAPGEIAVLVRKHAQAKVVMQALETKGVAYKYSGSQSLYEQPEVQIMLYFLQYITNPTDSVSLYHLLVSDVYNADPSGLMEAAGLARRRNRSLEEVLKDAEFAPDTSLERVLNSFYSQVTQWRKLAREMTVGQLAYNFLDTTGFLARLAEDSRTDPRLEQKVRHLAKFFNLLQEFERISEDKSALGYILVAQALRQAGDDSEAGLVDDTENREVNISTIHKSKGLEYRTVFLFDLVKGAFPAAGRSEPIKIPDQLLDREVLPGGDWHLQEERRLMYVAITRAKQDLILSYSPDHGGVRVRKPSPFITEALGVEAPSIKTAAPANPVEQIELFKLGSVSPSLPPRFMSGQTLHLTPHQIDDYLSCPENFRYLYVLEVPQPPQPALMYGSMVHAIIHQYFIWRQNGPVKLEQLTGMVSQLWRSDGFLSRGQEERRRQTALRTIERFWRREEAAGQLPKYSEKAFQFELPEYKVVVSGRFDAVYETKDGVEIRDFKTSQIDEEKQAKDKAASSIQLGIYALAWQQMSGQLPRTVSLDFVETGKIGRATKTQVDMEEIKRKIGKAADGIRAGRFHPGKSCFYCVHKKVTTNA
jgi:DNA helicase II / ATP-dependent DNA helicase PcrA